MLLSTCVTLTLYWTAPAKYGIGIWFTSTISMLSLDAPFLKAASTAAFLALAKA